MTTETPSRLRRSAIARPIPHELPVTMATFPARDAIRSPPWLDPCLSFTIAINWGRTFAFCRAACAAQRAEGAGQQHAVRRLTHRGHVPHPVVDWHAPIGSSPDHPLLGMPGMQDAAPGGVAQGMSENAIRPLGSVHLYIWASAQDACANPATTIRAAHPQIQQHGVFRVSLMQSIGYSPDAQRFK